MKLPSLQHLAAETARVVRRFPLTLLCALILGGVSIYANHLGYRARQQQDWIFPALSAAALGLSGTLAAALTAERYRWRPVFRWGALAVVLGLLALWYCVVPAEPTLPWGTRLVLLLLGTHLSVAAGPYLSELRRQADTPGFWRYNETLFLRILTATLYSGVLFAGCALALVAVEKLFLVDIKPQVYTDLLVVLGSVFTTWFFLAGVPRDFAALEQDASYPKGLKIFTQFVLLPLVVLYLGILYAYLGRIMVSWQLPEGWVSVLILAFSVAGIFALLLIHPIRHAAENTWIRTFGRWFYLALFPLLGLLAVAISTRIRAYGITEERYFVLVLAAWLFGIAIYFLVRRGQGIIWIPASLAVVALLAAGGPWGAFTVAQRSQLNQFREISAQYGLLKDDKLDGAGQRVPELPAEARKRISSIFDFFAERDAVEKLQPLFAAKIVFSDSLRSKSRWARTYRQTKQLYAISGLPEWNEYGTDAIDDTRFSFMTEHLDAQPLGQGRYWLRTLDLSAYRNPGNDSQAELPLREGTFRLVKTPQGQYLELRQRTDSNSWKPVLKMNMAAFCDSLIERSGNSGFTSVPLPAQRLTLHVRNGQAALHLYLSYVNRTKNQSDNREEYTYDGDAMLEVK